MIRVLRRSASIAALAAQGDGISGGGARCDLPGGRAEAHRLDADCPCGWHPKVEVDIETLRAALERAARPVPVTDLLMVQAAGRA